jgi:hypothetical protein
MEAGILFLLRGFCEDYPRSLERRILTGIHQAKALFPDRGDHRVPPWQWLIEVAGSTRPAYTINRMSIAAGWGAVFCALSSGTGCHDRRTGTGGSHDRPSAGTEPQPIDSG